MDSGSTVLVIKRGTKEREKIFRTRSERGMHERQGESLDLGSVRSRRRIHMYASRREKKIEENVRQETRRDREQNAKHRKGKVVIRMITRRERAFCPNCGGS